MNTTHYIVISYPKYRLVPLELQSMKYVHLYLPTLLYNIETLVSIKFRVKFCI